MRILPALAAALVLSAVPALAEECTPAMIEAKQTELMALIEADPAKAEKLEQYVAEVEAEYGGEPTEAQSCEALDKLIDKVEQGS